MDLGFVGCECPDAVKFNRSKELYLLNSQPVCIIEAIPLIAALLWNSTFALCPCYTIKLVFKLGLRMNRIKSDVVKEKIKTVWAN